MVDKSVGPDLWDYQNKLLVVEEVGEPGGGGENSDDDSFADVCPLGSRAVEQQMSPRLQGKGLKGVVRRQSTAAKTTINKIQRRTEVAKPAAQQRQEPQQLRPSMVTTGNQVQVETANAACQTSSGHLIKYACDLFIKEVRLIAAEQEGTADEVIRGELMKGVQHIIDRVKSKTGTSQGVSAYCLGLGYPGQSASVTVSPPNLSARSPVDQVSWHFDVGDSHQRGRGPPARLQRIRDRLQDKGAALQRPSLLHASAQGATTQAGRRPSD